MKIRFLVTPQFDKAYKKLKKKYPSLPEDIALFKKNFATNPHPSIPLGGGYRKVRIAIRSKGRGKSGGARIILYELFLKAEAEDTIILVDIYDKEKADTLKADEYTRYLKDFLSGKP